MDEHSDKGFFERITEPVLNAAAHMVHEAILEQNRWKAGSDTPRHQSPGHVGTLPDLEIMGLGALPASRANNGQRYKEFLREEKQFAPLAAKEPLTPEEKLLRKDPRKAVEEKSKDGEEKKEPEVSGKPVPKSLYAHPDNPKADIVPDAVVQGDITDCYFMATLAEFAKMFPEKIQEMIKDNKDGTFTVSFPYKEPITVKAPTDEELSKYARATEHGIWPAVMEKAFGALCKKEDLLPKKSDVDQESTETPVFGGWFAERSMEVLTGEKATWKKFFNDKQLDKLLTHCMEQKRLITASHKQHVYSVLDYDPVNKVVTLRNPYGDRGDEKGTFQMPFDEFKKWFFALEYVQKREANAARATGGLVPAEDYHILRNGGKAFVEAVGKKAFSDSVEAAIERREQKFDLDGFLKFIEEHPAHYPKWCDIDEAHKRDLERYNAYLEKLKWNPSADEEPLAPEEKPLQNDQLKQVEEKQKQVGSDKPVPKS